MLYEEIDAVDLTSFVADFEQGDEVQYMIAIEPKDGDIAQHAEIVEAIQNKFLGGKILELTYDYIGLFKRKEYFVFQGKVCIDD